MKLSILLKPSLGLLAAFFMGGAYAHSGSHGEQTMLSAFTHPFLGWDHLLTMLAVGLLAAKNQASLRRLTLPALFLFSLLLGSALALFLHGIAFSGMELSLALSVALCGLALLKPQAFRVHVALILALGVLHGWAHGIELLPSVSDSSVSIVAGMLLGSACLHGMGYGLGVLGLRMSLWHQFERWAGFALVSAGMLLSLGV